MARLSRYLLALCVVSFSSGCEPSPSEMRGGTMSIATNIPLGDPHPDSAALYGMQSLMFPLLHLPVGFAFDEARECSAREACTLRMSRAIIDVEGHRITPESLAQSLRTQFGRYRERPKVHIEVVQAPSGEGALRLVLDEFSEAILPYLAVSRREDGRWIETGPYRLESLTGSSMELVAIDEERCPSSIHIEYVDDERLVLRDFLAGVTDFAIVSDRVLDLLHAAGVTGDSFPITNNESILVFNMRDPVIADRDLRRCLASLLSPPLVAMRTRARLTDPVLDPNFPPLDGWCEELLDEKLPSTLVLETMVEIDLFHLAYEAVLAVLSRLGRELVIREIGLNQVFDEVQGHFRLTGWSTSHPLFPRAWLQSDGPYNYVGHQDPVLDEMLAAREPASAISKRLAEDPPFVPIGVMGLSYVTSHRYRFDVTAKSDSAWVMLGVRPRSD